MLLYSKPMSKYTVIQMQKEFIMLVPVGQGAAVWEAVIWIRSHCSSCEPKSL